MDTITVSEERFRTDLAESIAELQKERRDIDAKLNESNQVLHEILTTPLAPSELQIFISEFVDRLAAEGEREIQEWISNGVANPLTRGPGMHRRVPLSFAHAERLCTGKDPCEGLNIVVEKVDAPDGPLPLSLGSHVMQGVFAYLFSNVIKVRLGGLLSGGLVADSAESPPGEAELKERRERLSEVREAHLRNTERRVELDRKIAELTMKNRNLGRAIG